MIKQEKTPVAYSNITQIPLSWLRLGDLPSDFPIQFSITFSGDKDVAAMYNFWVRVLFTTTDC
jgi:hypothetical protein